MQLTTSLMNSTDDVYKDAALHVSNLRKLNFGRNGKLDVSKFKTYFGAMDTVVEMGGSGAHEKQYSQVSFILTTNSSLQFKLTLSLNPGQRYPKDYQYPLQRTI